MVPFFPLPVREFAVSNKDEQGQWIQALKEVHRVSVRPEGVLMLDLRQKHSAPVPENHAGYRSTGGCGATLGFCSSYLVPLAMRTLSVYPSAQTLGLAPYRTLIARTTRPSPHEAALQAIADPWRRDEWLPPPPSPVPPLSPLLCRLPPLLALQDRAASFALPCPHHEG